MESHPRRMREGCSYQAAVVDYLIFGAAPVQRELVGLGVESDESDESQRCTGARAAQREESQSDIHLSREYTPYEALVRVASLAPAQVGAGASDGEIE